MEQAEAFEQVLLAHAEMCYSVALALTRDPEQAQELAGRVLTRAWCLRNSARGRESIKTKLLTALRGKYLKDRLDAGAAGNEAGFAEAGMTLT